MTEVSFRRYAIPDRLLERLDLGETPFPISAPDEFSVCLDAKDPAFVPGRSKGKAIDFLAKVVRISWAIQAERRSQPQPGQ